MPFNILRHVYPRASGMITYGGGGGGGEPEPTVPAAPTVMYDPTYPELIGQSWNSAEERDAAEKAVDDKKALDAKEKAEGMSFPEFIANGTQTYKDLTNSNYGIIGQDGKRHKLTTAELAALGKQRKAEEKAALEAERIRQQQLASIPLPTPAQDAAAVKQYTQDRSDRSSEASEMLKSFDSNVAKVQAASKDQSAANKASTSKNAASVKSSLQSRSKGSTQGFAKGGLMTKKK